MNQNNTTMRNVLIQAATLCAAIIISLLLIIVISNSIIFPIIMFSSSYPDLYTEIVKILMYIALVGTIAYVTIYRIVSLKKAGVPIKVSLKNAFIIPARFFAAAFVILLFITALVVVIYFALQTNYILLHKFIHQ